jgi:hypothetical protein
MELSEQTLIQLVHGQGKIEQALLDMKDRVDRAIPALVEEDKTNAANIKNVEKKIWYFGGAGTAAGFLIEHLGGKYFSAIFGGK